MYPLQTLFSLGRGGCREAVVVTLAESPSSGNVEPEEASSCIWAGPSGEE